MTKRLLAAAGLAALAWADDDDRAEHVEHVDCLVAAGYLEDVLLLEECSAAGATQADWCALGCWAQMLSLLYLHAPTLQSPVCTPVCAASGSALVQSLAYDAAALEPYAAGDAAVASLDAMGTAACSINSATGSYCGDAYTGSLCSSDLECPGYCSAENRCRHCVDCFEESGSEALPLSGDSCPDANDGAANATECGAYDLACADVNTQGCCAVTATEYWEAFPSLFPDDYHSVEPFLSEFLDEVEATLGSCTQLVAGDCTEAIDWSEATVSSYVVLPSESAAETAALEGQLRLALAEALGSAKSNLYFDLVVDNRWRLLSAARRLTEDAGSTVSFRVKLMGGGAAARAEALAAELGSDAFDAAFAAAAADLGLTDVADSDFAFAAGVVEADATSLGSPLVRTAVAAAAVGGAALCVLL